MKKLVVLFAGIILLFMTGCSNGTQAAHKMSSAESSRKFKRNVDQKKLEQVRQSVYDLFIDEQHKMVDPDTTINTINVVGEKVSNLHGVKKQKQKLLNLVAYAKKHLAAAQSSQESVNKEMNSESKEDSSRQKESISSSMAAESSKKLESERAESSSKAISSAKKVSKANKLNNEYPPISSVFSIDQLTSYSSDELFGKQVRVSGTILDLGADNFKEYHILLQINDSTSKLLIVVSNKKTKKLQLDDNLTLYGITTDTSRINQTQINVGISESYKNEKVVLFEPDKVVNHGIN